MSVKIRKRGGKWYVFVNYDGRRKAKCVGTRQAAEEVRRQLEARFTLGDLGFLHDRDQMPTFEAYSERWLREYAEIECKPSTVAGYRQILKLRLIPKFGTCALDRIARDEVKQFLANLAGRGLSRNTLRNTLCTIRVILNQAIEDGLIDKNPAARLGRFTKSDKPKFQATPLTREECNRFLESTSQVCPIMRSFSPPFVLACAAARWSLCSGAISSLAPESMTPIATSWCSTTT